MPNISLEDTQAGLEKDKLIKTLLSMQDTDQKLNKGNEFKYKEATK